MNSAWFSRRMLVRVLALALAVFILYTSAVVEFSLAIQRGVPLALITLICLLTMPLGGDNSKPVHRLVDLALAAGALFAIGHLIYQYDDIAMRLGWPEDIDIIAALIGTVVVIELGRRTTGLALPIIAGVFLAYAGFGWLIPGHFGHGGYDLERIASMSWLSQEGVFGVPVGAMASFVTTYMLFGAAFEKTGAGRVFIDLARLVTRRSRSGPGFSAVAAGGLFGMVSGSGVSDTAAVGTFTIPVMKRAGYAPELAASIQALASIGAQVMPPIMGASAFLMAEIVGVPYVTIAAAAIVPALLYYLIVGAAVYFESGRIDARHVDDEAGAKLGDIARQSLILIIPIGVLLYLLIEAYTASFSVFWATVAVVAVAAVRRETRLGFRGLIEALEDGARQSVQLWAACAIVGIIVAMVTMTGIGAKFAEVLITVASGSLLAALILTMLASIVIGTGLPTVPSYLLLAILMAPALVKLGLPVLVAHFFIFYFGVLADLTPPTALAPFTAAGIARADPWRTTWVVMRLGLPLFALPFMFAYSPALLVGPADDMLLAALPIVIACIAFCLANTGVWMGRQLLPVERCVLLAAATALAMPSLIFVAMGLAALLLICFFVRRRPIAWPISGAA